MKFTHYLTLILLTGSFGVESFAGNSDTQLSFSQMKTEQLRNLESGTEGSLKLSGLYIGQAQKVDDEQDLGIDSDAFSLKAQAKTTKAGCPKNSFSIAMASDNSAFEILFNDFSAQVDPTEFNINNLPNVWWYRLPSLIARYFSHPWLGAPYDKYFHQVTQCTVMVPIEIPPRTRLSITRIDYEGSYEFPDKNTRAKFFSSYSLLAANRFGNPIQTGSRDIDLSKSFRGPTEEFSSQNFFLTSRKVKTKVSACGGKAWIKVANTIDLTDVTRPEKSVGPANFQVDRVTGIDSQRAAGKYFVRLDPCTNKNQM